METKEPLALLLSFIGNGIHKQVDSTINVRLQLRAYMIHIYSATCVCVEGGGMYVLGMG